MALERQGDYDAALTSYRLALRDRPNDTKILQNMAIAFTKTRRPEEAIRCYRRALEIDPDLSGAHYGLAFLLLKRGDRPGAEQHLEAFLAQAAVRRRSRALGPPRRGRRSTSCARRRSRLRRRRAIAWDRFSQSSVRRAASAKRPPRSTSPPRSRAAAAKTLLIDADPQGSVRYGLGLTAATHARRPVRLPRRHARDARSRAHDAPAVAARRARAGGVSESDAHEHYHAPVRRVAALGELFERARAARLHGHRRHAAGARRRRAPRARVQPARARAAPVRAARAADDDADPARHSRRRWRNPELTLDGHSADDGRARQPAFGARGQHTCGNSCPRAWYWMTVVPRTPASVDAFARRAAVVLRSPDDAGGQGLRAPALWHNSSQGRLQ